MNWAKYNNTKIIHYKNKLISIIIFVIFLSLIINPTLITNEIINAVNTFTNVLFPSIFPFFLLSDLLINYNFQELLNKLFSKINNFLLTNTSGINRIYNCCAEDWMWLHSPWGSLFKPNIQERQTSEAQHGVHKAGEYKHPYRMQVSWQ